LQEFCDSAAQVLEEIRMEVPVPGYPDDERRNYFGGVFDQDALSPARSRGEVRTAHCAGFRGLPDTKGPTSEGIRCPSVDILSVVGLLCAHVLHRRAPRGREGAPSG